MAAGNPALLLYFLQDDLYLLNEDKILYSDTPVEAAADQPETPVLQAPLVEQTPEKQAETIPVIPQILETPKPVFNYLGGNKKNFLILVSYPADQHMAEAHLKALESTLSRKTLSLDDVAILNLASHQNIAHEDVISFFSPEKLLILGAASIASGLNPPKLNTIEQAGNHLQLYTHSFDEMLADREKAKAFWEQMKNL